MLKMKMTSVRVRIGAFPAIQRSPSRMSWPM
jgi:hypothetical protein